VKFNNDFMETYTLSNGEQVTHLNKGTSARTIDGDTYHSAESRLAPWNPDNMFINDQQQPINIIEPKEAGEKSVRATLNQARSFKEIYLNQRENQKTVTSRATI